MLKHANTIQEYKQMLEQGQLPVLIDNRDDLVHSVRTVNELYQKKERIQKVDNLLYITKAEEIMALNTLILRLGSRVIERIEECQNHSSVALVCLYKDFTFEQVGRVLLQAAEHNLSVSVLLGRDLASLSFFVAKQFLTMNQTNKTGFLFSHARMNEGNKQKFQNLSSKIDYTVVTEKDMRQFDLLSNFDHAIYNRVIINTHGKEDHLNLGDYTLCGRNNSCQHTDGLGRPRCGYGERVCFKQNAKVIDMKKVNCEEVFLLSCSNTPYRESMAYDSKYNIVLNAIDGTAQTIVGATMVHGITLKEIGVILDTDKDESTLFLNDTLKQEAATMPFIQFGLASRVTQTLETNVVPIDPRILETMNNLTRLLVNEGIQNEVMRSKIKKLLLKCDQHVKQKSRALHPFQQSEYDKDLIRHIRSVERLFMLYLQKNSDELILKFGEVALVNNDLDLGTVQENTCLCGSRMLTFEKAALYNGQFNVTVQLCNRCGEKKFVMERGADFDVAPLPALRPGDCIDVKIFNKHDEKIPIGYFYPNYIQTDVDIPTDIQYVNGEDHGILRLSLKESLPPQQYYVTFFTVYNMQLTINRVFFQVEEFAHGNV